MSGYTQLDYTPGNDAEQNAGVYDAPAPSNQEGGGKGETPGCLFPFLVLALVLVFLI